MMSKHTILISGASGLVGSALVPFLKKRGHTVRTLVRRSPENADEVFWNPADGRLDENQLKGITAVIHLSGANVAGGRWTQHRRQVIMDSRVDSAGTLISALGKLSSKPSVFISASASGYYGSRGDEILAESSSRGSGFLSEVCSQWEGAVAQASAQGIRTVMLRFGVVLSPKGGALGKMLPVFKAGLGGQLGNGRQWMSWIALEDLLGVVALALDDERAQGPINTVAPEPVRNAEFTAQLAKALHRPCLFPVPASILRIIFGEMAQETLLVSSRVVPAKLVELGYHFSHPKLDAALRHLLSR